MSETHTEWRKLKAKIQQGDEWRETANVPVAGDTFEMEIRMLTEDERLDEVIPRIDMAALQEHEDSGQSDAEERIEELQSKDDLTEAEQEELDEAQQELSTQEVELLNSLGSDTLGAIRDAGRMGVEPTDGDVDVVLNTSPSECRERFRAVNADDRTDVSIPSYGPGDGPVPETREEARTAVKKEMQHFLDLNPYMVKFTLGMQVLNATQGEGNSNDESAVAT
jgi:hypothetical protein